MSKMNIFTCDNYDLETITLEKPIKKEDVYESKLSFVIQTPVISIHKINDKRLTLNLTEGMENLISAFDNKLMSLLVSESETLFEDTLTMDDAEDIYKNSIRLLNKTPVLNVQYSAKLNIYNKTKDALTLDNLSENDTVICLLKCKKIQFYKNHCQPRWEVAQIKLKEPKINKKTYLIMDDENDTYVENSDNESEIKCLKIKA